MAGLSAGGLSVGRHWTVKLIMGLPAMGLPAVGLSVAELYEVIHRTEKLTMGLSAARPWTDRMTTERTLEEPSQIWDIMGAKAYRLHAMQRPYGVYGPSRQDEMTSYGADLQHGDSPWNRESENMARPNANSLIPVLKLWFNTILGLVASWNYNPRFHSVSGDASIRKVLGIVHQNHTWKYGNTIYINNNNNKHKICVHVRISAHIRINAYTRIGVFETCFLHRAQRCLNTGLKVGTIKRKLNFGNSYGLSGLLEVTGKFYNDWEVERLIRGVWSGVITCLIRSRC